MGLVMVIEDEERYRTDYERWLTAAPCDLDVRSFGSTHEAEQFVAEEPAPDGLILDQMLPGELGMPWLGRNGSYFRGTRIFLVTGHGDAQLCFDALKLNATLVIKPAPYQFFVHFATAVRARAMARRASSLTERQAERVAAFSARWSLSVRQTEILILFARGFVPKEIATELKLSVETIKKHVHALLKRAHLPNMREVMREIWAE